MYKVRYFFFFSSRRRHTRYWRDWSSDVCSSDLSRITTTLRSLTRTPTTLTTCTDVRSEEHTSELQSRQYLVCRLLLEKKKTSIRTAETKLQHFTHSVRSAAPMHLHSTRFSHSMRP